MGKTWVLADIHGAHKALVQCLERSGFDRINDTLIQLGDVVDGWSEVYECVEELLNIPNLISIKGNHDEWFNLWLRCGIHGSGWKHGAFKTLQSYGFNTLGYEWDKFQIKWNGDTALTNLNPGDIPEEHKKFFEKQHLYYIDEKNRCFVHGGFNRHLEFKKQTSSDIYFWDRDLWMSALCFHGLPNSKMNNEKFSFKMKTPFKEIFIGHTATINWNTTLPMRAIDIWNLDTGAGFKGKLTIMNVETKEYFQSDLVEKLYPNQKGR